jgi:hypothetical protein
VKGNAVKPGESSNSSKSSIPPRTLLRKNPYSIVMPPKYYSQPD